MEFSNGKSWVRITSTLPLNIITLSQPLGFFYSEQEAFELETLTSTVGFYSLAACKVVQLFLCNYGRTLKFAKALLFRNSNIPPSVPSCMQLSFLFYVISFFRPFDGRLISAVSYVSRIDYLMTAVTLIH